MPLPENIPMLDAVSPPGSVLNILMLEDNLNDAELIRMYLKSSQIQVKSTLVSDKQAYINALKGNEFDVILSDHILPQFNSLEALRIRNKIKFHIPFILVSGAIPEEYAVTILQEGANDYILKDRPQRLVTAITEAIKKQKTIADKIQAEQELTKINERLRLVGKATADAVWDYDVKQNKLEWGEGVEKLFGYKTSDLPPDITGWTDHIHPDDLDRVLSHSLQLRNDKSTTNYEDEYRYVKADGTYAVVVNKGIILRDDHGMAYRVVGAMQDITETRELEQAITEQKLNQQKQNTEIAIQSQEEERAHLGKELHDNINQLMASAKMMIDMARSSPDIQAICLNKGCEAIDLAIDEVRRLSHALVAPVFTEGDSFFNTLKAFIANIRLSGNLEINLSMLDKSLFKTADEKIKLTFYRIIQEQLNNVLKYAKASQASLTLRVVKNSYQLVIEDNGVGFDCEKKTKGIGLRNIANRAELLSGKMEIISSPGNGCVLKIEIPVR